MSGGFGHLIGAGIVAVAVNACAAGPFDGSAFSVSYDSSDCGSRVFTLNRS
jgi:hypothetical protein